MFNLRLICEVSRKGRMAWTTVDYISEDHDIDERIARNLVKLFEDDCTIPFISRYRKEQTGNMEAAAIRNVFRSWEHANQIKKRQETVRKEVAKSGNMTQQLESLLKAAKSLDQIENLYAPFKPGSKKTLAERARTLGLEEAAMKLLSGRENVNLNASVNPGVKGLKNVAEVLDGIKHILADHLAKQTDTQDFIKRAAKNPQIQLQSKFSKSKGISDEVKKKYENYSDFCSLVQNMKAHQVLGINRGEKQKILAVKILLPESFKSNVQQFFYRKYTRHLVQKNGKLAADTVEDCYARLIQPQISRTVRQELAKNAEMASVDVFGCNVKQLLLAPPVKKCPILGIDPGFTNGCKIAAVSLSNEVLDTGVVFLPKAKDKPSLERNGLPIRQIVMKHKATRLAIGNGSGCRETELWISQLLQGGFFKPLDVEYCIVSEQGASIYSVSDLAVAELPDMDPNLRSAVSLARRVLDPLAELLKVEPKHLGVGMYQHDVDKKLLKDSVDSHVEECVSFVGVDLNTASLQLLQRIAGLNKGRASKILEFRKAHGRFTSRSQLKEVKGIGDKSFQQSAGFVRIFPLHAEKAVEEEPGSGTFPEVGQKRKKSAGLSSSSGPSAKRRKVEWNPLDATSIHPESYPVVERLLKRLNCCLNDIGGPKLKRLLESRATMDLQKLSEEHGIGLTTLEDTLTALQQPLMHDIRQESDEPLFRKGVRTLRDLSVGTELSGAVSNVTDFGAFVDVGVGRDGLIHVSQMRGTKLSVGERVSVSVVQLDIPRKRIGLRLLH